MLNFDFVCKFTATSLVDLLVKTLLVHSYFYSLVNLVPNQVESFLSHFHSYLNNSGSFYNLICDSFMLKT